VHRLESKSIDGFKPSRWRTLLPIVTQFMFGGLWSGFLIFYSRSATLAASWPFLLVLGAIFLGNEVFKKYHDRFIFNVVLYFFALYSYAIFAVPVITKDISTGTFLLSGVAAVAVFAVFMVWLRHLGRVRVMTNIWQVRFWVGLVLILMNVFYFTNILPPLPIALSGAGIYHSIARVGGNYQVTAEPEPWYVSFGLDPVIHEAPGEFIYAYSAIFAPVDLSTNIIHRWQWYDTTAKKWITESLVSFPISGGREKGYRGYTNEQNLAAGAWRVDIETTDGRIVGRLGFTIVPVSSPVPLTTLTL
jgi:hypothetical protein